MLSLEKKGDQRAVVQFCLSLGNSPTQTYALMKTVYGNDVLSRATIFHWHALFAVGRAFAAHYRKAANQKHPAWRLP